VAAGASFPAPPSRAAPPPQGEKKDAGPKVTAVPEEVARKFKFDTTFYKKHVDYKGFSILGSARVSDAALLEARDLIDQLLGQRVLVRPRRRGLQTVEVPLRPLRPAPRRGREGQSRSQQGQEEL